MSNNGREPIDLMKRNIIFCTVVCIVVLGMVLGIFIRGIETESIIENKNLANFPEFTFNEFIDSSFQNSIEEALSDQLLLGQMLKNKYNKMKNTNLQYMVSSIRSLENTFGSKEVSSFVGTASEHEINQDNSENLQTQSEEPTKPKEVYFHIDLTPKGNSLMEMEDTKHLIYPARTLDDAKILFQSKADNYNYLVGNHPDIQFFGYYIETDVDVDFINGVISHTLYNALLEKMDDSIKFEALSINRVEDYQSNFYMTDHHWNTTGQYKGYKDIIHLIKGQEEPLLNIETVELPDIKYNGYKSRRIDDYSNYDAFAMLKGDLPAHEVYVYDSAQNYGKKQGYELGQYKFEQGFNYYADCFGGDDGLVEYCYNQPDEGNLLVFVDSFSNPIKEIVASHFNNTYYIDLRNYEAHYGHPFDFGDFVSEHDITKVLFTGYYFFYANDTFLIND